MMMICFIITDEDAEVNLSAIITCHPPTTVNST
jgi:hypothetical protein